MNDIVLELVDIQKSFDSENVLNKINLQVKHGEFITLLGSSGCGKTTTLRIIAGLETPNAGKVCIDGADVTSKDPNERDVNTVFQNYALFPHMTVGENVGYGLKLKKLSKAEIKKRVTDALNLVQLPDFAKRNPNELSGGQKQRVAIARAIVNNPKVLLLDEPLGALDLQLRRAMQIELKKLQQKLGITFIYITHDQEEAINMSDRIAVMNNGHFEQIGTPDDIYYHPLSSYVATFIGNSNLIPGIVKDITPQKITLETLGKELQIDNQHYAVTLGQSVTLVVRSEDVIVSEGSSTSFSASVTEASFAGGLQRISLLAADNTALTASRYGLDTSVKVGNEIHFHLEETRVVLVDLESR